ncbi:WEB family protein At1g75720-like [Cynara cardunculus var. scolymus]|uniref:Uncharacterized protein n=1 Tax=Cynara cardunculus var. scolymus TaxID=59895 RepID=A0A118JS49_CYNCS|nr:WEB family protein At1g75720-like [Cynara cardunculus var. scolymus]KVH88554.1 hypothetical protein Ccrd_026517 [Cynara cardunculus var. scolymus]
MDDQPQTLPPPTIEDDQPQTLPPPTIEDDQPQTLPENLPPATKMEDQTQTLPESPPPADIHQPNVDTSRPFRSVKEAVAVFGERFLTGEIYSPSPKPATITLPKQETQNWKLTPSASNRSLWKSPENEEDPPPVVMNTLKKLESELEETKRELNMLKDRESETEVALASLNAELHKNMSKIAKAEAEVAGKAASMRSSTTLRQVLSGGSGGEREKGRERKYVNKERKTMKKKPVIPLVTDLFTRNKEKPKNSSVLNPHYTSYWN